MNAQSSGGGNRQALSLLFPVAGAAMLVLAWTVGTDGLPRTGGMFQRLSAIEAVVDSVVLSPFLLFALLLVGFAGIGILVGTLRLRQRRLAPLLRGRVLSSEDADANPRNWWETAEARWMASLPTHRAVSVPAAAVARARQCLAPVLSEADVALIVDPLPEVFAEPEGLTEIFTRLIDNAVRFRSPHRRPVIHISAARDGAMIEFRVRDNGLGIDPARAARLFEILRQTGPDEDTIGAGLALVRRWVERMGGTIWVDLSPGQVGTTFGFSMPALPITAASRPLSRRCHFGEPAI